MILLKIDPARHRDLARSGMENFVVMTKHQNPSRSDDLLYCSVCRGRINDDEGVDGGGEKR